MRNIFKKLASYYGLEITQRPKPIYVDESVIRDAEIILRGFSMLNHVRMTSLADQVGYCNLRSIPGAFVECGVWKGGSVALMAYVSKAAGYEDRDLHLLDAFSDICAPNPEMDGAKAISETAVYGAYNDREPRVLEGIYDNIGGHGTIDACKNVILNKVNYPESKVHFHKGWFQDTAFKASGIIGPIALLRLDGDWYESTKICLEAFYDNVVKGGVIIIDDYLYYEGCKRAVDEFIEGRNIKVFLGRVDPSCYYFVKME